jgi:hypothetical protein
VLTELNWGERSRGNGEEMGRIAPFFHWRSTGGL